MISRRGFFGMLAGLAAAIGLPKSVQSLGKKDYRFADGKPYTYTTFLMGPDAIVNVDGLPAVSCWRWDYDLQEYVKIPRDRS